MGKYLDLLKKAEADGKINYMRKKQALNEFYIFTARNSKSQYEFAERLKLKFVERGGGRYCIRRLINKQCCRYPHICVCKLFHGFGIDHPFAFRYPDDPSLPFACFVWFPYGLHEEPFGEWSHIPNLAHWCESNNLKFKTFEPNTGWYGYRSYMVVVWREWEIFSKKRFILDIRKRIESRG